MKLADLKKLSLATAALLVCGSVFFEGPVFAGEAGTTSAAFLKLDPSPRASGMGEAYTAVTQDAYSPWWNPAGLAGVETPEFAATQNASIGDVTDQYIALAYPLSYGSALAVSMTRHSVAPFQGYDAAGGVTRDLKAFSSALTASYARTLIKDEIERPVLNAGVGVKSVSETLDTVTAKALAYDAGLTYYLRPAKYWMRKIPAQEFRFSVAARNLGGSMKFDKEAFPLPQTTSLGAAWISHPAGAHTLTVAADVTMANDAKQRFNVGAEYFMYQLFSVRGGYASGQDVGSGVRMGIGFRLSFMDIDYSLSPFGDLGNAQKLGITVRFGGNRAKQPLAGETRRVAKAKVMAPKESIEALKLYANDYVELARKSVTAREYVSAVASLNKAFNLEPALKDGAWGDFAKRLNTINARLSLAETPVREQILKKDTEQSVVAHEAVKAYAEGYELKAFLLAHAALGANPRGDAMFEDLLNNLADLTRNTVRRAEIMPRTALVKEKLKKAAKGFYIQQFDTAAKECEEVVLIDETNPLGWTRLGSAYYMMGDKAKARKAYEKVLELDPADAITRQFMEAQGWK